jgi:hypothetical protein
LVAQHDGQENKKFLHVLEKNSIILLAGDELVRKRLSSITWLHQNIITIIQIKGLLIKLNLLRFEKKADAEKKPEFSLKAIAASAAQSNESPSFSWSAIILNGMNTPAVLKRVDGISNGFKFCNPGLGDRERTWDAIAHFTRLSAR